jgi:hypothetical protein
VNVRQALVILRFVCGVVSYCTVRTMDFQDGDIFDDDDDFAFNFFLGSHTDHCNHDLDRRWLDFRRASCEICI